MSLIVPRHVAESLEERAAYLCTICGKGYPEDHFEKWVRHVRNCSEAHEDEIQEAAAEQESDYFRAPADKELFEHIRQGGN